MKNIEKKIYRARIGSTFSDNKAEEIGKYRDSKKLKTPQEIYEDTQNNEASPFYSMLEWNNDIAGDKYRIDQIKNVINHISVTITYEGGEVEEFDRALIYVDRDGGKEITLIEDALDNIDDRKSIIINAWGNLEGWLARYKQYKEFDKIVKAAEEVKPILEQNGFIAQTAI